MSSLFQWQEPHSAVDADWAIYHKLFTDLSTKYFKYFLVLALIGLISLVYWGKNIMLKPSLAMLGLIFYFWCNYHIRKKSIIVLTDNGIRHHFWQLIPWNEIELYSMETQESLRRIEIKAKGKWYRFYFDPQETNEAELRAVLNKFLPREREMVQL